MTDRTVHQYWCRCSFLFREAVCTAEDYNQDDIPSCRGRGARSQEAIPLVQIGRRSIAKYRYYSNAYCFQERDLVESWCKILRSWCMCSLPDPQSTHTCCHCIPYGR